MDNSLRVRRVRRRALDDTGFHSQSCVICHVTCKGRSLKSLPQQHSRVEFEEFRGALAKLLPDQREALILVGASGFSYEEAAAICESAVGTIKSRVHRARTRLVQLLSIDSADRFGPDQMTRAALTVGARG